jgi:hypothetical protein
MREGRGLKTRFFLGFDGFAFIWSGTTRRKVWCLASARLARPWRMRP